MNVPLHVISYFNTQILLSGHFLNHLIIDNNRELENWTSKCVSTSSMCQSVISGSLALFWDKKHFSKIRIDPVMLKFLAINEKKNELDMKIRDINAGKSTKITRVKLLFAILPESSVRASRVVLFLIETIASSGKEVQLIGRE